MRAKPSDRPLEPCPHCGADHDEACLRCPTTDMVLPFAGRLLAGKFRFVAELGRGGMGAVWRARNIHVDRDVALKLILPEVPRNPEMVARFQNEARVAARIGHAGICDILDFEQTGLGPVIVMELLRGENFAQRIAHAGPLPVHVAVGLVRQALSALEAAHRAGIIHRDLKPENLFLHQPDKGPVVVKLMDFGISKFLDRVGVATRDGVIMGTPEYMAPEQVSGAANADARTDIWAIAAVLHKALTGVDVFTGGSAIAILLAITSEEPAPLEALVRKVPAELSAVIRRCLSKSPDQRYQTARELSEALRPFEAPRGPLARREREGLIPSALVPTGLHPTLLAPDSAAPELPAPARAPASGPRWLVAVGLLAAGAAGTWFMLSRTTDPATTEVAMQTAAETRESATEREVVAPAEVAPQTATIVAEPKLASSATSGAASVEPAGGVVPTAPVEPVEPAGGVVPTAPVEPAAADAASPPATDPSRLVASGDYVTPTVAGEPGNQHWAKEYCEALAQNKFLGVARWKLANPREARLFVEVVGIQPAAYWTSANYRGKGLVVWLPRGNDRSLAASTKSPRPLCVAPKA